MSSSSKRPICRYFLRDSCKKGESCPDLHRKPAASKSNPGISGTSSSRIAVICPHFLRGKCAYGTRCTRSHKQGSKPNASRQRSGSASASPSVASSKNVMAVSKGNARESPASERGTNEDDQEDEDFYEPEPKQTIQNPNDEQAAPCVFFHSMGKSSCDSGDTCGFLHDGPVPPVKMAALRRNGRSSDSPNIPCKHYLRGNCKKGSECQLMHSDAVEEKSSKRSTPAASFPTSPIPASPYTPGRWADEVEEEYRNHDLGSDNQAGDSQSDEDDEDTRSSANYQHQEKEQRPKVASPTSKGTTRKNGQREPPGQPPVASPAPLSVLSHLQVTQPIQQAPPELPPPLAPVYPHISQVELHWSQFADPLADVDVPFCKLHARGACVQGDTCRFRHSLTVEEYISLFRDPQPNLVTLRRDQGSGSALQAPAATQLAPLPVSILPHPGSLVPAPVYPVPAQAPTSPAVPSSPPLRPLRISAIAQECKFYSLGKCRNGDKCPYAHTQHPDTSFVEEAHNASSAPSLGGGGGNDDWTFGNRKSSKRCIFFTQKGWCRAGASCPYRHGDRDLPSEPSGPQSSRDSPDPSANGWGAIWGSDNANDAGKKEEDDVGWGDSGSKPEEEQTADDADGWGAPIDPSGWDNPPSENNPENNNNSSWGRKNDRGTQRSSAGNWKTRAKPCFQYSKGWCNRGDSCRFSHDEPMKTPELEHTRSSSPQAVSKEIDSWGAWDIPIAETAAEQKDSLGTEGHESATDLQETVALENINVVQEGENADDDEEAQAEEVEDKTAISNDATGANDIDEVQADEAEFDDDEGWAKDWAAALSIPDIPSVKIRAQCIGFAQGFCRNGDGCQFMHIDPNEVSRLKDDTPQSSRPPSPIREDADQSLASVNTVPLVKNPEVDEGKLEPIIFNHPDVKRTFMNSSVSIGPDCAPDMIETVAESRKLRLSNLPSGTSVVDVKSWVQPLGGTVRENSMSTTSNTTSVEVGFPDTTQARLAFESLHYKEVAPGELTIVASLDAPAKWSFRIPEQKLTLKLSWPKPGQVCWSHYPTVPKAKAEAARLTGVVLKGRKLVVDYITPDKRQKENFAVKFSNLPPGAKKTDLEQICEGYTIITAPEVVYSDDPQEQLKERLSSFGEYDFDLPLEEELRPTMSAFVTFHTEAIALETSTQLGSGVQEFLGKQALEVRQVHFSRYRTSRDVFDSLRKEVDRLKEKVDKYYTLQYDDVGGRFIIRLSSSIKNYPAFAEANAELCTLLQGGILQTDDGVLWDDYFDIPSSVKVLQQLKTDGFIFRDERSKSLRVFGSKDDQAAAKAAVLKLLSKVHAQRHEVDIPRGSMRFLIMDHFATLQATIGVNKLSFDVFGSKIVVRGSLEDYSKVSTDVEALKGSLPEWKRGYCEICHREADGAIVLSCRHTYCTPCLALAARLSSHAPLRCIAGSDGGGGRCTEIIPYIVLHGILPAEEEERLLLETFHAFVRLSDQFFFCPSIGCKVVYPVGKEGQNIRCFWCSSEICSSCGTLAHVGLKCVHVSN